MSFKNFGSYGNKWQELEFNQDELILVQGHSGVGKSIILEVIQYGLYGKVKNKKLKDLVNRINSKGLEVKIELISNGKEVKIRRGIDPSILEVEVDGNKDIGDIAGISNIQDYLETEIYKLPYHVFVNIIAITINDFKSFLKLPTKEKKLIIDRIFGLEIFNTMYELLKNDIKKTKDKTLINRTTIDTLTHQIDKTTNQLLKLENELKDINQNKQDDIKSKISECNEKLEKLNDYFKKVKSLKNEYVLENKNLNENINKYKTNLKIITKKIELYSLDKCPTCEGDLNSDYHNSIKIDLDVKHNKLKNAVEKLSDAYVINNNQISDIDSKILKCTTKISQTKSDITRFNIDLNESISEDDVKLQTNNLQLLIDDTKIDLENGYENKKINEKELSFLKIVDDIIGEKGVKTLAIKTLIPSLNANINSMMKDLNLDYKLIFDDEFNANIYSVGKEIDISTLSTGEQKRLDFTVLMAIIKLMKNKYPHLNLLFLDELFASVDGATVYEILKILSNFSKKLNLNIFVVNHATLDASTFTHIIKVDKSKGFSTFTKMEF